MFDALTRDRLAALLEQAGGEARSRFSSNIATARKIAGTLDACEEQQTFIRLLEALAEIAGAPEQVSAPRSEDHDYGNLFKLCRSVQFAWGSWIKPDGGAGAMAPHFWALAEVLSATAPNDAFRLLEIGCGTGSFGYDVAVRRRQAGIVQSDLSLESLVFALLLQAGTRLVLPRRVDFERSPDGIGWFAIEPPRPDRLPDLRLESLPQGAPDIDILVAIHSFSLFDEPSAAVHTALRRLRPGGIFLWVDLLSWRTETPPGRRIAGDKAMADIVAAAGLTVTKIVADIPYLENWGFERTYDWRSHAILAVRPNDA